MNKLILVLTLILCLAISVSSYAAGAYLVVATLTNTGNTSFDFNYHKVDSLNTCMALVENAKIAIPNGGDAEAAVIIYCAPTPAKAWEYKEMRRK